MESDINSLKQLAIKQSLVFKKIENCVLRQQLVLNEINCFYRFIFAQNPTSLPTSDVRYRSYVITFLGEFKDDQIVFRAILTGEVRYV